MHARNASLTSQHASSFALRGCTVVATLSPVRLAAVEVGDAHALGLAMLLRHRGYATTADRIERAALSYERDVCLTLPDRDAIVDVLSDPPDDALATLEATLLRQLRWRRAVGLF